MKGERHMPEFISTDLVLAESQHIETDRLMLRPIRLEDAKDMFAYASDDETTRYVFQKHVSVNETKRSIAGYFMSSPLGKWAIEEKKSHRMIGTIDLRVEEEKLNAELGYVINREYWGKGYVPEAAEALLKLGFFQLDLIRIYGIYDIRNIQSGRVMEKLGMSKEGVIPNYQIHKDELVTIGIYGITKELYKKGKTDV